MIVNLYIPDFIARIQARVRGLAGEPVLVRDRARVLGASQQAREIGVKTGALLENQEISDEVYKIDFDLKSLVKAHDEFLKRVQRLSPIVESLRLGEVFLEIEDVDSLETWFDKQKRDYYPLCGAAADTGWLARVVARRLDSGQLRVIDSNYLEELLGVSLDEFWGLGLDIKNKIKSMGFETIGELYYLSETDRRKYLGRQSRLFHNLFNKRDPRAISVFSRPRSLSREFEFDSRDIQDKKEILNEFIPVINIFHERLTEAVSLAYRLKMTFRFENQKKLTRSYVFGEPADDVKTFKLALSQLLNDVAFTVPVTKVSLSADVIVADTVNYHLKPREEATDFEII